MDTIISTRIFIKNKLEYTIKHVYDELPDLSYLEQDYMECPKREMKKYQSQDKERLEAYKRDEWYMVGVIIEIYKWIVSGNGAYRFLQQVGNASLWGIESDAGDQYFEEVENSCIAEAEGCIEDLRKDLCS